MDAQNRSQRCGRRRRRRRRRLSLAGRRGVGAGDGRAARGPRRRGRRSRRPTLDRSRVPMGPTEWLTLSSQIALSRARHEQNLHLLSETRHMRRSSSCGSSPMRSRPRCRRRRPTLISSTRATTRPWAITPSARATAAAAVYFVFAVVLLSADHGRAGGGRAVGPAAFQGCTWHSAPRRRAADGGRGAPGRGASSPPPIFGTPTSDHLVCGQIARTAQVEYSRAASEAQAAQQSYLLAGDGRGLASHGAGDGYGKGG